ncbi:hypothetical protein EK904_003156, partial [Melospiza melodia maxima]
MESNRGDIYTAAEPRSHSKSPPQEQALAESLIPVDLSPSTCYSECCSKEHQAEHMKKVNNVLGRAVNFNKGLFLIEAEEQYYKMSLGEVFTTNAVHIEIQGDVSCVLDHKQEGGVRERPANSMSMQEKLLSYYSTLKFGYKELKTAEDGSTSKEFNTRTTQCIIQDAKISNRYTVLLDATYFIIDTGNHRNSNRAVEKVPHLLRNNGSQFNSAHTKKTTTNQTVEEMAIFTANLHGVCLCSHWRHVLEFALYRTSHTYDKIINLKPLHPAEGIDGNHGTDINREEDDVY